MSRQSILVHRIGHYTMSVPVVQNGICIDTHYSAAQLC